MEGSAMVSDRIEREIVIAAPVERVWSLVIEPAFWVGEGDPVQVELREGAEMVSEHAEYGRFPQRIEKIEPQRYISYRWASGFPGEQPREGNSTLVEFTLIPEGGTTRLRVVESGFTELAAPEEARRQSFEDNTGGWAQVLDGLKQRAEQLVA
jgi:uncharacterized protein YndB with AHSA1/START domain